MTDPRHQKPDPADLPTADTDPGIESEQPGAPPAPRTVTFPPDRWDSEDAVFSSANPPAIHDLDPDSLSDTGETERLGEAQARTILDARFHAAGARLQPDYPFQSRDLIVNLDGFDPVRRLGYAYLSHADADVVTDFDPATELAFEQLASECQAFVLIIHDTDVPSRDALEQRIDAFFTQMRASTEDTQRG